MHYQNFTWRMSNRMLNAKLPEQDPDLDTEVSLFSEATDIGRAWNGKEEELLKEAQDPSEPQSNDSSKGYFSLWSASEARA